MNVCLLLLRKVRKLRLGQFDSPRFNSSQKLRESGEVGQAVEGEVGQGGNGEGGGGGRGLQPAKPAARLFLRWDSPP